MECPRLSVLYGSGYPGSGSRSLGCGQGLQCGDPAVSVQFQKVVAGGEQQPLTSGAVQAAQQ